MAKKIKFTELTEDDRKKLKNTVAYSLSITFLVCVILVGCFACTQQVPNVDSPEQTAEKERLYWTGILDGTVWAPQTNKDNDGMPNGIPMLMNANIDFDTVSSTFVIGFGEKSSYFKTGSLTLSSCEGIIKLVDGDTWSVKFSEKNDILYMRIVDSVGKTVYYTGL